MSISIPNGFTENDKFSITYRMKVNPDLTFTHLEGFTPEVVILDPDENTRTIEKIQPVDMNSVIDKTNSQNVSSNKKITNVNKNNVKSLSKKQTSYSKTPLLNASPRTQPSDRGIEPTKTGTNFAANHKLKKNTNELKIVDAKVGKTSDIRNTKFISTVKATTNQGSANNEDYAEIQNATTIQNANKANEQLLSNEEKQRSAASRGQTTSAMQLSIVKDNEVATGLVDDARVLSKLNSIYQDIGTINNISITGKLPDIKVGDNNNVNTNILQTALHESYQLMILCDNVTMDSVVKDRLYSLGTRRKISTPDYKYSKNTALINFVPKLKESMTGSFDENEYISSALFFMCKEFLRIPIVLLILATENYNFNELKSKVTYTKVVGFTSIEDVNNIEKMRNLLLDHVYLKSNSIFEEAFHSASNLETEYNNIFKKYGRIRIDQMSYLLFQLTKGHSNDPNILHSIRYLCERISLIMLYWTFHSSQMVTTKTRIGYFIDKISADLYKYHNKMNSVVTFVKIRKDGGNYNRRYNVIESPTERTILEVHYNDTENAILGDKVANKETYNNHFSFGPFTQIFNQKENNIEMLNSTSFNEQIFEPLISGRSVCIIGYGASGAGKTSVLIKFQPPGQPTVPGILMLASNKLGWLPSNDNNNENPVAFTKCSVNIAEFLDDINKPKLLKNEFKFEKSSETRTATNMYPGTWNPNSNSGFSKDKSGGKNMEDWIMNFMDTERSTFPTPNNPVSSRSHVVITMTYTSMQKTTKLVVCDFAGVENTFNCSIPEVVKKFSTDASLYTTNGSQLKDFQKAQINANFSLMLRSVESKSKQYIIKNIILDSTIPDITQAENQLKNNEFCKTFLELGMDVPEFVTFIDEVNEVIQLVRNNLNTEMIIDNGIDNGNGTKFPEIREKVNIYSPSKIEYIGYLYPRPVGSNARREKNSIGKAYLDDNINYVAPTKEKGNLVTISTSFKNPFFIEDSYTNLEWNIGNKSFHYKKKILQKYDNETFKENIKPRTISAIEAYDILSKNTTVAKIIEFVEGIKETNNNNLLKLFGINNPNDKVQSLNEIINWIKQRKSFPTDFVEDGTLTLLIKKMLLNIVNPDKSLLTTAKIDKSSKKISELNTTACGSRVTEGKFINSSLKIFREYIRDVVLGSQKNLVYPPFIGECVEYQCNPTFKECFGVDQYTELTSSMRAVGSKSSALVSTIIDRLKSDTNPNQTPLFCIFCVLNVSAVFDAAREPPPVPFINNVTPLESLLQTLQNAEFDEQNYNKELIIESIIKELDLLIANMIRQRTFDNVIKNDVISIIDIIKRDRQTIDVVINNLKMVIELIAVSNAATPLGTLQFTELFSKLFSPTNVCNIIDRPDNQEGGNSTKLSYPYIKHKKTKTIRKQRVIKNTTKHEY